MPPVAGSKFIDICNKIAWKCGQNSFDSSTFDDTSTLDRPQAQIKLYAETSNQMLMVRLTELFTERYYTLQTVAGVSDYPVDASCNLEGVKYHSMRCNTTANAREIDYMTYNEYRNLVPDPSLATNSKPQRWTDLTTKIADAGPADNIRFWPTPDDVYEIEYRAKLTAKPLSSQNDTILWPYQYEHVLILWGEAMMKRKLGDASVDDYAKEALDSVRAWAPGPMDKGMQASFGKLYIKGTQRNTSGFQWGPY
jgi:hypothetical protein